MKSLVIYNGPSAYGSGEVVALTWQRLTSEQVNQMIETNVVPERYANSDYRCMPNGVKKKIYYAMRRFGFI